MNRNFPSLLCVALCLVGCEDEGSDDISLTYLQEGCRGGCPMFSIIVNNDRTLQYVGFKNVLIMDTVFGRATNQQIFELIEAFKQSGYFGMKDEYSDLGVTDMASAITSMRLGSTYKSIRHYFGDRSAPQELRHLYSRINQILNTKQWVGHDVILEFPDDRISAAKQRFAHPEQRAP